MKIIFMGTPDFSVGTLEALVDAGHDVCLAVTQPDKPKGRGKEMQPTPVKEAAERHGIPVYQPKKIRDPQCVEELKKYQADVMVVIAFGQILPRSILELTPYGCINVHASLLPKYRGAAPIQWSILRGEKTTGVTTMYMAEGLDTGDMLMKAETEIGPDETAGELHDRLSQLGADLIVRTLDAMKAGTLTRTPQDDALSCYAPILTRDLSKIAWTKTAQEIHNQVRGLSPWPSASTVWGGKTLKIHKTKLLSGVSGAPGEVKPGKSLVVCCGEGAVELLTVQYEGGKRMSGADFLLGHPAPDGTL